MESKELDLQFVPLEDPSNKGTTVVIIDIIEVLEIDLSKFKNMLEWIH